MHTILYSFFVIFTLAFYALTLSSCASNSVKNLSSSEHTEEMATIFFSRKDSLINFAGQKDIHLSGEKVFTVKDSTYTSIKVIPGDYVISAEVPWSKRELFAKYEPTKISITAMPSKTYYVHLNIDVDYKGTKANLEFVGGLPVFVGNPAVEYNEYFTILEPSEGSNLISSYSYRENKLSN